MQQPRNSSGKKLTGAAGFACIPFVGSPFLLLFLEIFVK
jgi:hypothetical protein